MYYPVLRGKQFELIALREISSVLDSNQFCPIIEPVRSKFQALGKTISHLNSNDIEPIIIINPNLGDFDDSSPTNSIFEELASTIDNPRFLPCFSTKNSTISDLKKLIGELKNPFAIYVEEGLSKEMLPLLSDAQLVITSKYQRAAFKGLSNIVVVKNHFNKAIRNSAYPDKSFFSDIHTDYKEGSNVIGYGDYTITGDDFLESGGPAYVVAIHLSYIDPNEFDAMYIRHFKSFDDSSPTRPGEKFGDALEKLVGFTESNPELFLDTLGLQGFKALKSQDHFPGLGQVKKLSIQHHIETLCRYEEE